MLNAFLEWLFGRKVRRTPLDVKLRRVVAVDRMNGR